MLQVTCPTAIPSETSRFDFELTPEKVGDWLRSLAQSARGGWVWAPQTPMAHLKPWYLCDGIYTRKDRPIFFPTASALGFFFNLLGLRQDSFRIQFCGAPQIPLGLLGQICEGLAAGFPKKRFQTVLQKGP